MTAVRVRGSLAPRRETIDPTPPRDPLLVLLPSLGTTTAVWAGVVDALHGDPALADLRILAIDHPGHGESPAVTEPFTIPDLATAVLDVIDELGDSEFHLAGISLGGAVALEIALREPTRVQSLTIVCSGARIGSPAGWVERARDVRSSGTASLVTGSAARWFAPGFLGQDAGVGARALAELLDVDDESYGYCAEALGRFDRTTEVATLHPPTLLVSADLDVVTTAASMRELADTIPGSTYLNIPDASHLATLERPAEIARALGKHLAATRGRAQTARVGDTIRRAVLGDTHVAAATTATTPATAAFQDFIGRYAWGEIWARPGLSRRDRSIATLASLVTAGHETELRMHLRAALRNGLTQDELSEILLHTSLYAGLPAANAAFAVLRDVLNNLTEDADG
jgi:3-oxoadipate enol-lactonase/4-carboxymuconolactone decarboxylase